MNMQPGINTAQLGAQIAELQQALLAENPRMPTLLREIHTAIKKNPEQVTLLDDEQIAVVVAGLEKFSGIQITTTKSAKSAASGSGGRSLTAQLKNLSVDDF